MSIAHWLKILADVSIYLHGNITKIAVNVLCYTYLTCITKRMIISKCKISIKQQLKHYSHVPKLSYTIADSTIKFKLLLLLKLIQKFYFAV